MRSDPKFNILIVDDDEDDAYLVSDTLSEITNIECNIFTATSSNEGLKSLQLHEIDIILCDYLLGANSGIDFINLIRENQFETPVILLTGMGDKSVDHAALEAGASDYLSKESITPDVLDRAIRYAIANFSRHRLMQTVVQNANAAVAVIDQNQDVVLSNSGFKELAQRTCDVSIEFCMENLIQYIIENESDDLTIGEEVFDLNVSSLPDDGKVIMLYDVTERVKALEERKEAQRRISHLAMHDGLTGLPNRSSFNLKIEDEISIANSSDCSFDILLLDLDRFKEVNDVFGHKVGDELLINVANMLQEELNEHQFLARLGGDEFVAIHRNTSENENSIIFANRLYNAINRFFEIDDKIVSAGVSIGISTYPDHGNSLEDLLSNADVAMYRAKSNPTSRILMFDEDMDEIVKRKRILAHDLKFALEQNEIEVHFQPQVLVKSRQIVGFESLARWKHPIYNNIGPSEFIPIAEENGLIIQLGNYVLRKSCEIAANWPEQINVAVNVSAVQLKHSDLVSEVLDALYSTGLSPTNLELEITESVLIDDLENSLRVLRQLKAMGISIAVDDFGTGYSSLISLVSFPFDKIKIDRSFIEKIGKHDKAPEIVRAILGLAKSLNFCVLAEGVENSAHVDFLVAEDCQEMQGYLIGKPASQSEILKYFSKQYIEDQMVA